MFIRNIVNTMVISVVSEKVVKVFPKNFQDTTIYMTKSSVSDYVKSVNKNAEKFGYVLAWENN